MRPLDDPDGTLPGIEAELDALLEDGRSRVDATMAIIERITNEAHQATTVVLVEGLSDAISLEVLAERQGKRLRKDGTVVVPAGGVTNFARLLTVFGPRGRNIRLAGLYDSPVEDWIRRSLEASGVGHVDADAGLEPLRFYRCVTDLEEELIRTLGPDTVEQVVAAEGELASLRKLQQMPSHRDRPLADQLHRFIGSHAGRKYRYARALALSLDVAKLPAPLTGLLGQL